MMIVATALMAVGVVMVTSAAARLDASYLDSSPWRSIFGRQMIFALIGLLLMVMTARAAEPLLARPRTWGWITVILCGASVLFLMAAFLPGWSSARHGSSRWVSLAGAYEGLRYQPSELAKVALIVLLAWWFGARTTDARAFRAGLLPAAVFIGLFVILVGREDFSTSFLLAMVGGMMLLVAGCRWTHLGVFAGLGAAGLAALVAAAPYRVQRLIAFRDIWKHPQGAGYQPLQSLTTIASGGWMGAGLGSGIQKYGYLPESHSDFILSVLCEEAGALGGAIVILLFCAFVYLGLRTMWQARTAFEQLVAFGLTACLGLQAALNISVVFVVAPTTGIPLPFVSAGGSGVLTYCLMIGILAAIARRGEQSEYPVPHIGSESAISFVGARG